MKHIWATELSSFSTHIPEFLSEFFINSRCTSSLTSFAKTYQHRDQRHADLLSLSMAMAHQVQQRQCISGLIISGNISESLDILTGISGFLSSSPDILFDLKCQHFIELIRDYFEHPPSQFTSSSGINLSLLLSAAQSIADVYTIYGLDGSKRSILRTLFSLFLYVGKLSRSELPSELRKLLEEENRIVISESILKRLILYSGEKPFSNLEILARHTASLLEELYSHTDFFPSALLIKINDFI